VERKGSDSHVISPRIHCRMINQSGQALLKMTFT